MNHFAQADNALFDVPPAAGTINGVDRIEPVMLQDLQLRLMEIEASLDSLLLLLRECGAEHVPVYGMECLVGPVLQRVKEAGRSAALIALGGAGEGGTA